MSNHNTEHNGSSGQCKSGNAAPLLLKAGPNLEKLPDRWEKRLPDFHGIAWYKIHFSYTCDTNIQSTA